MDTPERSHRTWLCTVIFLDIVGYSKTLVAGQMALKQQLNTCIARAIEHVPMHDRLMLDTGDGAALCFMGDPEDALFAALHLRDTLATLGATQSNALLVRIGINLGPAKLIKDINGQLNVIGDSINVAQRVMNFSEPNQILVSRSFYEVISCLSQEYEQLFHYRGVRTDKHVREHAVYEVMLTQRDRPSPQATPEVMEHDGGAVAPEEHLAVLSPSATGTSWDASVLQQIEKHLAYHVGPLAKLLVAQAATQVSKRQALCHMLATHIPHERERHLFLAKVLSTEPPEAATDPSPSGADDATAPGMAWSPEILQGLTAHLVNYLGPVGKLLVTREAKRARDLAELQRLLAEHIAIEAQKQRFLRDVAAPGRKDNHS
jgi:class 3 adenylate cyclase